VTAETLVEGRLRPSWGGAVPAGLAIAGLAVAAEGLGRLAPAIGAPAIALVLGMALRVRYAPDESGRRVVAFASRTVLQAAIVVLGATFSLGRVAHVGRTSLPLMLTTLALALVAAWFIGTRLKVPPRLQVLVGVGTAICGASAIGAVSAVVGAAETEIAYAISTIFVFNVVAVVLYPALGHLMSLGQHTFGLWAGTAVNDTSSVVAAGYAFGATAGGVAVVTKLARTTMIVPIVLALAVRQMRTGAGGSRPPLRRLLPMFLVWFLAASALNTAGFVSPSLAHHLSGSATVLITVALAAIGLSTRFDQLRRTGARPFLLGAALWAVVGVSGLALQLVL
jgi:uncharacterized integral membrane protein (TIGR00698 family)